MEVYKEYLLTIRNSLIQCGVGLPLKDDYTYEELFELSEVIDQILWYYSILAVSNSRNKLKGFIFSLDDTYMSVMRRILYLEYCETQKDYKGLFVEDLETRNGVSEANNSLEDDGDQEDALNDFRSLILSKKENKPIEDEKFVLQFDELDDEDDFPDWGDSDDTEEEEDAQDQDDSFEKNDNYLKESDGITYISKDSMSVDEKGFYVYDGDEEDEDPDPFLEEEVEEEYNDISDIDDDVDFPELDEDDEVDDGVDDEVDDEVDDTDFPEDQNEEDDLFPELEDDVDSELENWGEDETEEQGNDIGMSPDDEDDIFGEDSEEDEEEDLFPDWKEDDEEDEDSDESQDDVDFPDWGNDSEDDSVEDLDDIEEDDLFPSWGDDDTDEGSDDLDTLKGNQEGLDKVHKEKVVHKKEYVKDQEDILAETLQGAVSGVINLGKRLGKKGMSHISNNINRKE